jgi:site-specific DNA recombinase
MNNPVSPITEFGPNELTAVLYLRVSTPSQVSTDYDPEGISIPAQREACQRKAFQLGARIVETYVEPGKSATSMDKRPEFQKMLDRIRTKRDITYVIVYKLSRMNRNRVDDALVLASLRKYKATLISATESIDETPVGQLMHGILAAFNEYRSAEDGADIKYKMRQKAKNGGTLGKAPLGYLNVRDRFEGREIRSIAIDPERAPFITLAFELYATGNYGFQALADELTIRGLRGRQGRYPAAPVSDSKIQKMLSDRYYLGIVTVDGAEYPGRHQPLVTPELFEKVQTVLAAHSISGERRRIHQHYLKGTPRCARCHTRDIDSRLIYTEATGSRGTTYTYFKCIRRGSRDCDLPHLATHLVEDAVTAFWTTQRLPHSFITRVRVDLRDVLNEADASRRLLDGQLTHELARINRQEENLIDLAANATDNSDNSRIRTRLTELQTRRRDLQARLDDSSDHLQQGAAVLEAQLDLLQHPDDLYRRFNDNGKRQLNQAIFEALLIDLDPDADITITGPQYTEPVQELMTTALSPFRSPQTPENPSRTTNSGPTGVLPPSRIEQDRGWNKTSLVEVLAAYGTTYTYLTCVFV